MLLKCRNFSGSLITLLVAAYFLQSPAVPAAEQSQTSALKGIEAFKAGEYEQALEYFADAITSGLTEIPLYYNIGVAHYKLNHYEEADEAFKKVAESPKWESLALYNRALIAYRQNELERAKDLATQSIKLSKSPGLTALNYRLIEALEKNGLAESAWSKLLSLGLGFNDNVVISEAGASAISGKSDTFLDFAGRAKRSLTLKNSKKLDFVAQASLRNYTRLNEYDQLGLRGGFEKALDRPNSSIGAYLENDILGGKSFELITSFEYKRALSDETNHPLLLAYGLNHYSMLDSNYSYLGGIRHRVRLEKERNLESGSIKTYIRAEYNDREDQTVAGNFYSFSPIRAGLGVIYKKNLSSRQQFSGSLFVQQSHFKDPDSRSGVFKAREDGLLELRLGLARVTRTRWIYRANYVRTVNSSNYSEFSYNQNIVSLDILRSF